MASLTPLSDPLRFVRRLALSTLLAVGATACLVARDAFAQDDNTEEEQQEGCTGDGDAPVATPVEVEAVPITVESTAEEYFVLYVRHDLDADTTVEVPVLVALGEDGTTTLAENATALPAERYRVEKYLVADPADVDGDCIDDITELADPVGMNPVNPAPSIEPTDGVVTVPDQATLDAISFSETHYQSAEAHLKLALLGIDTDSPSVYFVNTKTHPAHSTFVDALGLDLRTFGNVNGDIVYFPEAVAPDGRVGVYALFLEYSNYIYHFSHVELAHTVLTASMPVLEDDLALYMSDFQLQHSQADLPLYRDSRIDVVFDEDLWPESFSALNLGEGYGLLRSIDPNERPNPRDVVVYETLPNDLPRVAGIVTTVPQTPLSHVNLRAIQDRVPNAFIRDALDNDDINDLIGSHVHYEVTEHGYQIRAATRAEVDAHYASSRPVAEQTPQRDLSVTSITPLSQVGFEDWTAFGVKAANVAVLGTLDLPEGTVPDGFAVPFYFYDEFMKANGLYDDIETMLADHDFQTDFDTQESELKKLRKAIKNAPVPDWITEALTAMHASYPEGQSLRYRSSTNNEDLPGFNGAGLYDSKTQHPDETEEDGISKSLKQVYASLWNFRAFTERDFHRIDHKAAAMGVLVHPNYSDELANGVAVSFDPIYDTADRYYVNSQIGEDLVTNPDAHSVPEEILLADGYYIVVATSNQAPRGQLLMSRGQLLQLRDHLEVIHDKFAELYGAGPGERWAIEIEFKITSDNKLAIKQARPWVFDTAIPAATTPATPAAGEEPTITTTSRPAVTFRENGTGTVYAYRASDPQRGVISWSVAGPDADAFTIGGGGELAFASPPDFENPTDVNGDNVYELKVGATDEQGLTDSFEVTVTVTNDAEGVEPTISTRRPPSAYRENGATAVYALRASDPQRSPIAWTLDGEDSADFDLSASGTLTFHNPPDFEAPADSNRDNNYELTVVVTDEDGHADRLSFTVAVTDVNEGPEISRVGSAPSSVAENYDPSLVLARYSATDPEGSTVSLWRTSGGDGGDFVIDGQGALRFRDTPDYERPADSNRDNIYVFVVQASDGAVYGSFEETVTVTPVNEAPAITTAGGSATELSQDENRASRLYTYRATDPERETITWSVGGADGHFFAIDERGRFSFKKANPPDFEQPADSDGDNVYDVAVQATDDTLNTASLPVTVTVTEVNEGPEVTGRTGFTISENQDLAGAAYTAVDPENPSAAITRWSVTGRDAADFTIDDSGRLTFRKVPDHERPADSGRDNVYNLSVRASDGRYYGYLEVTVTVTDVNEAPAVTGTDTFTFRENGTTALHTFRATDPERSDVTWSVSGQDAERFAIHRGMLTLKRIPDFEDPADDDGDNVYDVTVAARDDAVNTGTLEVTVTVVDQDEGPQISGLQSLAFSENQATDGVLATYSAADPEDPSAPITRWSVTGRDAADFAIDDNGELTFRRVPDYERPDDSGRDNTYEATVRASDGRYYGYLEVTVTVTDVNEAPEVTGTDTFNYRENGTANLYTFRATDPERSDIEWSLSGADAADFAITDTGVVAFAGPPDYENPTDDDGDNVYEVTVQARDDALNTGTLDVAVTVTHQDEGPEISGPQSLAFSENQAPDRVLATYTAIDPEDPSAAITRWSLTGHDAGDFAIDDNGELTFRRVPDYERPADSGRDNTYEATVRASDGRYYGYLEVTVTVEDVNEAPAVTGTDTFNYRENGTANLYTFKATDPERSAIEWSLSGADAADFAITDTGVVAFAGPPDYEGPTDDDGDNVYDITVEARDDALNTGTLDVAVTVTDVNEGPEISGRQSLTFTENQAPDRVLATYSAADPENPSAAITRWSVTGRDAGDFTIDDNGRLTFRRVPDHERPDDSGRDNTYEATVRASDGRYYGYLEVTVAVTDANEAPAVTGTDTFNYRENGTAAIYTFKAADPERGNITWSLSGTDDADFAISETGVLSFASPPDFESRNDTDSDNVYEVTVQARDDAFYTGTLDVVVTVTDVNEGPEIAGQQSLTFTENQATDRVLATYSAADPEDPSAAITRWTVTGRDAGDFTIDDNGRLTFRRVPDYERPDDSGRDNVYNLSVRASDGRYYGYLEVTVTVTDANEAPEVTGTDTFNYRENSTANLYTFKATDPERSAIEWSLSGADDDDFTITDTGVLAFAGPPDYENAADSGGDNVYEVTVQARDDALYTGTLDVVVTVTDVNEGPEISGLQSLTFTENQATDRVLATYSAADPEDPGAAITRWSVTGRDAGDFTIDENGELTFRNVPDYERPDDSGRDNVYNLSVRASDGRYYGYLEVTATVTDVNEAPAISASTKTAFTYRENGTAAIYTFKATDPERSAIEWSLSGADGSDFTIENGALKFTDPPSFESPQGSGLDGNEYLVTVEVRDDAFKTSSLPVTVTVTDQNEGPEISGLQSLSFTENQATDRVLATYTAADPEDPGAAITRWSVTGRDAGDFAIDDNGELTFRKVPDYERPDDSGRDNVYNLSVRASDGRYYGYLEVTVAVTDVNEAPAISASTKTAFTYRENSTAAIYTFKATDPERSAIEWSLSGTDDTDFTITDTGVLAFAGPPDYENAADSGSDNVYEVTVEARDDALYTGTLDVVVTVTDVNEGPEISGLQSLTFTENQATDRVLATYSAADPEDPGAAITRWSVTGRDAGDFTIDESGELTFRNVPDYEKPDDSGRDNVYNLSVRASDGRNYGYLEVTVAVTDVNEAPAISASTKTAFNYRENGTANLYTFKATDPERSDITWSLSGADAADFTITDTGVLAFAGAPDYENPADDDSDNVYDITVEARDDDFNTSSLPVTVTVTDVNEGPEISGLQSLAFSENQATDRVLATYSAADPEDPGAAITRWSVTGRDAGDFTIDESGELTFRNVPDYERPDDSGRDNVYNLSVRASDGRYYGYLEVTVTVQDVNEAPAISASSKTAFTYRENGTANLYTFKATDPERSAIEWSLSGADDDDFTITDTGVLAFAGPPDYEGPTDDDGDNVYDITVEARDDALYTGTLDVVVTVTDVNEGPEISGLQSLAFTENQATDRVLATYSAADPEDPSAAITRWSVTGRDAGDFTIDETGELTFRRVPDYERPDDSGRDNIYEATVRASDGRYYGYLEVTVAVTDVNEAPEVTGTDTFNYRENGTANLYTFKATDPERSAIEWSLSGADDDDFAITDTGVLAFAGPPDYENAADSGGDNVYEVTVQARDDDFNTSSLPVTVTVTDVNEGPEISGPQSLTFTENQATDRVLATYSAADPEDPSAAITRWSVTGRDSGDFTIDESGELTFRNVPDYERPADSGRDNVYNLSVRASDGRYYGYLEVTVAVTDVNEAPAISASSKTAFNYRENGTANLYTFKATDPERSAIEWSLSGADDDDFAITDTGVLAFASAPDYENAADSGSDNVYEVTVQARDDDFNSGTLEITVTVTDANEGPEITGQPSLAFTENQATDRVLATYSAADPEDPSALITRWSLTGTDSGDFRIDENGQLTFRSVPDHEKPADSGRDNVYNLSVRASDGRYYGYLEVTVTVEAVNEPPAIAGTTSFTYKENGTATLHTFRATDPERSDIAWSLSGADADDFTISDTGVLAFASTPDYESPADTDSDNVYEVTVEARDDSFNTGTLEITITVVNLTD